MCFSALKAHLFYFAGFYKINRIRYIGKVTNIYERNLEGSVFFITEGLLDTHTSQGKFL